MSAAAAFIRSELEACQLQNDVHSLASRLFAFKQPAVNPQLGDGSLPAGLSERDVENG